MMKKSWGILLLLIIVSACTKKQVNEGKVLYETSQAQIKGLDPVQTSDTYAAAQIGKVYEGLLQYHYLKRPYELIPNLAQSMPEVSKDGLTYTFKIKSGVYFHDNKCFPEGKGRMMTAHDVVYSIKRAADVKNGSIGWWLFDGKLVGLNEWRENNSKKAQADYNEVVEGVKALDDITVEFKLAKPYPQFLYALAMSYSAVVPREAVDFYGKEFLNNPVGTGPFITDTYTQSNQIVFYKNPKYREEFYPSEGTAEDAANGLLEAAGKRLPLVDKIVVNIEVESLPRWLSFEKGNADYTSIPKDQFDQVVTADRQLNEVYKKKGMELILLPDLDVTYIAFNMDDSIVSNQKLRHAMAHAYNQEESNKLFYNNTAILSQGIIPPGIAGYDPNFKNEHYTFDLEKAKALLKEAGYPEGKGLPVLKYDTISSTVSRQMAEYLKKQMALIGINIEIVSNTWPQLTEKVHKRQTQMYGMAWLADYPDAENFLQLIYGKNASPGPNGSNFNDPAFNALFEKATMMQDSPERTKLYEELNRMAAEKMPIMTNLHRSVVTVKHGWLKNFKYSAVGETRAKYLDMDIEKKLETKSKL